MKPVIFTFLIVIAFSCGNQQNKPQENIKYTNFEPKVDGLIDSLWYNIPAIPINKLMYGYSALKDSNDLSASFRIAWDSKYLYLLVHVLDDVLFTPPYPDNPIDNWVWVNWNFDNVNIFLSVKNRHAEFSPDDLDLTYLFNIYENPSSEIKYLDRSAAYVQSVTSDGYVLEIRIPNEEIGLTPKLDKKIGFEVLVGDNDNTYNSNQVLGGLESQLAWSQEPLTATIAHESTKVYGTLVFKK